MVPVVTVTGSSDSGKTTFVERIVPLLEREGLRVGSVKHAPHGFDGDRPGSDSHRHASAGADPVALVGPEGHVLFLRGSADVDALVARHFDDVDVVLVEGLASRPGPKILINRSGVPPRQHPAPADVLFVVTDEPVTLPLAEGDEPPPEIAPDDLEAALALLLAHLASVTGVADALRDGVLVELEADGDPVDLDADTAQALLAALTAALPPSLTPTTAELILRLKLR